MGAENKRTEPYVKFLLYLVAVILVNLVGFSIFFRADLTRNHVYTLSEASKKAMANLSGPLTIDVFFTDNLPAPYNGTKRYLKDLLEEYSIYAKKPYFNYRFFDVSSDEKLGGEGADNRKLAESYGIRPVQIQVLEKDEVKFKNAYMGLVIIYGDLIEHISPITSTNGLEYKVTTTINKLNNKISKLAGLQDKIKVELILSPSLKRVFPIIGLKDIDSLPGKIRHVVEELNKKNYGKLEYRYEEPDPSEAENLRKKYRIMTLKWPSIPERGIEKGDGLIGILVAYKDKYQALNILNAYRIPLFGTQYQLADKETISESINGAVERLIGINVDLGYMSDHGTLSLYIGMNNIKNLLSDNYTIKDVRLADKGIPIGIRCLVIAHPTEKFTDYELYQIDQALMRGTNIAIFSDAFKEKTPISRQQAIMGSTFEPLDTGLEKLLAHYGVHIKKSYVLDKNCYKQIIPSTRGGGERLIYFAPIIKSKNINHDLPFLHNIKGLVTIKNSPVTVDEKVVKDNGLKYYTLFTSSKDSWEMQGMINLNPIFLRPPESKEKFAKRPLACLIEGSFTSYFKGKPIPVKEKPGEKKDKNKKKKNKGKRTIPEIHRENEFIAMGRPAKIAVIGSQSLLKDNMIDARGESPNSMFVLNLIDYLNGRTDIALMRSKLQRFNPLYENIDPSVKEMVKFVNIVGLPVLVVLAGLFVWWRRRVRRMKIREKFEKRRI